MSLTERVSKKAFEMMNDPDWVERYITRNSGEIAIMVCAGEDVANFIREKATEQAFVVSCD